MIRYKGDLNVKYGLIKYFLNIDSCLFVAVINLEVNLVKGIRGRTGVELTILKRQGVLDLFFSKVKITNNFLLIIPNDIICKCITYDTYDSEWLYDNFSV